MENGEIVQRKEVEISFNAQELIAIHTGLGKIHVTIEDPALEHLIILRNKVAQKLNKIEQK